MYFMHFMYFMYFMYFKMYKYYNVSDLTLHLSRSSVLNGPTRGITEPSAVKILTNIPSGI